jgi:hypothetical protein
MPTKKKTTAKTPAKTKPAKTAKKKTATKAVAKAPTASALAASLGVAMTAPLSTSQIRHLVKPLPGYVGLLDDVGEQLDADASLLNLKGLTGASLIALQTQQKSLSGIEAVTQLVYNSVYQQRQQVDSQAMGALFQINKRVEAMKSEDPQLVTRWAFLSNFLRKFHPGTNTARADAARDKADVKAGRKAVEAAEKSKTPVV